MTVKKGGKLLGLEVEAFDGPLGLVILDVKEDGLMAEYNKTAPEGKRIEAYCSIYAVNKKEWHGLGLGHRPKRR